MPKEAKAIPRMLIDADVLKSRRKYRALTRKEVSEVRILRGIGYPLPAIGLAYGVTMKTVHLACKEGYVGR